jgi:serine phosphatase RsbU (regulator of sigma subunit)/ligand-binding sensor domain-containing protein
MILKIKAIFNLLMLLSFTSFYAVSDIQINQEEGNPFIHFFDPQDYKAGARSWSIAQDERGIMYFGNQEGVLEYDGKYWRRIDVPGYQNVRSIASGIDRKMYLACDTDFGYLKEDSVGKLQFRSLATYLDEEYKSYGEVSDVVTNSQGAFFKTRDKIFHWDFNKITVWDSVYTFNLFSFNDTIYFWDDGIGLTQIDGNNLRLTPGGEFFSSLGVLDILSFSHTENSVTDEMLIVTYENGLFIQNKGKFRPFKTDADRYLIENQVYSATKTSDNNYAFATQRGGLVIINREGALIKIINEKSGLQSNICFEIFADKNQGIWLTTEYGINYLKEPSSLSIYRNSGDLKTITNAVIRHKDEIYAATEIGAVVLDKNSNQFKFLGGSNKPAYFFNEIQDELLVATGSGTYTVKNNQLSEKILDGLGTHILESKVFPNRIYIGTYYGFSVLEKRGEKYNLLYQKELLDEVIKIVESEKGSLWITGFFNGIISVEGNLAEFTDGTDEKVKYTFHNNDNGLPGNSWDVHNVLNKIIITTDTRIYSFDYENKSFVVDSSLGTVLSQPDKYIVQIKRDKDENLWIMAYIDENPVIGKAVLQNGTYNFNAVPDFSLLNLSTISSFYPDAQTGKLWISSDEGLLLFDPRKRNAISDDFTTLIRKVTLKGDSLIYYGKDFHNKNNSVEIDYKFNDIAFEYSATHYDKPNSTYFRTYLEGYDESWSNWSVETRKEFTNLSHGSYRFKISSKNIYGVESEITSYSFTILAPWYLSWWAYLLYIAFIGGSLYSIRRFELNRKEKNNKIRMSELKAEAAEFQAKVAETQARLIQADNDRKTKELEEARDLQLSMLPKSLPEVENLDIAVFMQTATEVGGDYYDFSFREDKSLNVCLGDATGHGMKAGTLVSMMKSLFVANSVDKSIEEFFSSSNRAIKNSKLDRMMMAFAMVNIIDKCIKIANAGIPPVYIFRQQTKNVEEVKNNGLPLGAMKNPRYEIFTSELETGDIILMLSDGFPELQNNSEKMIGYEKLKEVFKHNSHKCSQDIILAFKNEAQKWIGENEPDDDITFIVIKVK